MKKAKKKDIEEEMEESVEKLFKKLDKIFEKEWGKKCKKYYWRCIICRLWDVYERFKKDLEIEYLKTE